MLPLRSLRARTLAAAMVFVGLWMVSAVGSATLPPKTVAQARAEHLANLHLYYPWQWGSRATAMRTEGEKDLGIGTEAASRCDYHTWSHALAHLEGIIRDARSDVSRLEYETRFAETVEGELVTEALGQKVTDQIVAGYKEALGWAKETVTILNELAWQMHKLKWTGCTGSSFPPTVNDSQPSQDKDTFKSDLKTISQESEPTDGDVIELPDDPKEDVKKLADDDRIDPDKTYVIDAACHESQLVSGRTLIRQRQVQLTRQSTLFEFTPCRSDQEMLKEVEAALSQMGLSLNDVSYGILREPRGQACRVWVKPLPQGARANLSTCSDTAKTSVSNDKLVDRARDDPAVDRTDPPRTTDKPLPERNDKSKAAQVRARPVRLDPHFTKSGSWGQSYPDQWGLHRIGFAATGPSPWPATAEPVVVAVLDSGVDHTHPDLAGSLWINSKEIPHNGKDDDGNGYVDDGRGWNFIDGNDDVRDLNGHGTAIAGIIAAWAGNGIGIAGVNPWARIMPIKVGDWQGEAWNFDIADAIRYAADNGARVINISYEGKRLSRSEQAAIAYARGKGALIVVAAGNDGASVDDVTPAGLAGVITVAATDQNDRRAAFSNWGGGVDIAAPGMNILSTRARHTDPLKFWRADYKPGDAIIGDDRQYYLLTGTSFAAPLVSGVASLILSIRPELDAMQVSRMLLHSARDIETPGWDQYAGYGLVDARAALAANPDYYILPRIFGVRGSRASGQFALEISGRAMASQFRRAWIEAGQGDKPTQWTRVAEELKKPVANGTLALVPPARFQGSKQWTLRLIVEHRDGSRREARFTLTLE